MTVTILRGDSRQVLKTLPENSVHTCVTSPPYLGLRDYKTANWTGGSTDCDHIEKIAAHGGDRADRDQTANIFYYKHKCAKCGAIREDNQIGLEDSPEEYIQKLVELFREVRRVLRDDGTLWLNLGDSYNNFRSSSGPAQSVHNGKLNGKPEPKSKKRGWDGLKEKDLIGIPWRVALALQADGWYLRQDIIWSKPNPMPESVLDRCTKAHEYIFLMSKSPRYYFDHKAIQEPVTGPKTKTSTGEFYETRNKRSVWNVATKPYKEAHFATFPPELIEPCILAGAPTGGMVLDPFGGSGTTGMVSEQLGRNATLIELNPEYIKIAENRISHANPKLDSDMFIFE